MSENPYAGQGPVLLDIGGEVGALVVAMPAGFEGLEVEIRLADEDLFGSVPAAAAQEHSGDGHSHSHGDHVPDEHGHDHSHDPARPHVAVVARSVGSTVIPSLVFPELVEGRYELYRKDGGPVELTATILGGQVTSAVWPG